MASYVKSDRDLTPVDVGGDLKVATLNALNYFLTLDGTDVSVGPTTASSAVVRTMPVSWNGNESSC